MISTVLLSATFLLHAQSPGTGQELVNASFRRLLKAESASFKVMHPNGSGSVTCSYKRGGLVRVDSHNNKFDDVSYLRTPQAVTILIAKRRTYMQQRADHSFVTAGSFPGLSAFDLNPEPPRAIGDAVLINFRGTHAYRVQLAPTKLFSEGATLMIDRETGLPCGFSASIVTGKYMVTAKYEDMRLNEVEDSAFAWNPPSDWTRQGPDPAAPQPEAATELLGIGTVAPEFAAKTPSGGQTSLGSELRGHKAVLLAFWFSGGGSGVQDFPRLRELHSRFKKLGLAVLAMNEGDEIADIRKCTGHGKAPFKILMTRTMGDDVSVMYKVETFPAYYVIGPNGRIVTAVTGFDKKAIYSGLAKLGLRP